MDNANGWEDPTRREYVKYGGALLGGGMLAGCAGSDGSNDGGSGGQTTTATTTTEDTTYTVSMGPVGDVTFESQPQDVMVYSLLYADMAVAYGAGDAVNSLGFDAEVGGKTLDAYYERLDGVAFDGSDLTQLNTESGTGISVDLETFYELDSDLHLVDPALVLSFKGWSESDIEEVRENVAPWFGNAFSRNHGQPPEAYRDSYRYYTLWEIAEKVSQVFRARERYEALAAVHADLLDHVRSNLPPEEERPTVASVIYMGETFYPSKINTLGFANGHVRPLGAHDAFAEADVSYQTSYDFEAMLEVDPDVVLHRYGIDSYYDVDEIRRELADHSVGSDLAAIENDRFYPGGTPVQGPLMNLFQLEMTAKQLYPDVFGAWPAYDGGAYPDVPEDEQLFDRQRVADIIAGDV